MASVVVREDEDKSQSLQAHAMEPLRFIREILRGDPFRSLFRSDPFAEMMPTWAGQAAFVPAFDVRETQDGFVFKADLPGVKEADLDLKLSRNRLTVAGKRESEKSEKNETVYSYERSHGSFTRAFTLPEGVDTERVKAELKEGVLTIEIPKRPEVHARKIPIKTP